MATKQEWLRERIVQFAVNHTKSETLHHFLDENIPRSTIYNVLSTFNDRGTTERQKGSGRPARIMTNRRQNAVSRSLEANPRMRAMELARKFNCSRQHMQKTMKNLGFNCYHRQKAPKYTPEQVILVKRHARWIHDRYPTQLFVIDDEKYFTLSDPRKGTFYARNQEDVEDEVRYMQKEKYEKKLMVYLAISERGISEPFFVASGLGVNQEVYLTQCLKRTLIPFLRTYHADNNYVFWPDKASSHYARSVVNFLETQNISFVPKEHNPTNLPQCRPIEDLWGYLVTLVYGNGWQAETLAQLKRRVRWAIRKVDQEAVRASCSGIRKKLRLVYQEGPYAAAH